MKNKIITIMLIIILFVGVGFLCYPAVSNLLRDRRQDKILTEYNSEIEKMSEDDIKTALKEAQEYNEKLLGAVIISDPFDPVNAEQIDDRYSGILNLEKNGIIGYVEIPRIDVYEPIYHGTSDSVLSKGVGHLENTSFPIGGIGTHAVLSGHTGLPEAEIFTGLTSLDDGDIFFIHILNDTLAYKVNNIKVTEPSDTKELHIDLEQDYVTLVTCTPYGINSHRLLVRGTRVDYTEDLLEQSVQQRDEGIKSENWKEIYAKAVIKGVLLAAVIISFIIFIKFIKEGKL